MIDIANIVLIQSYTIVAVAMIICVSAISSAFGFAYVGCKFLESIARQPEMAKLITSRLFLVAGLLDAIPIMGIGIALWFATSNPFLAILSTVLTQG